MSTLYSAVALGAGQIAAVLAPLFTAPAPAASGAFGLFHIYLIFLILGGLYAVFVGVFASFGGDHDVSAGHDVDVGHDMDVGHDTDLDHGAGHEAGHGAEHGELIAGADASITHLGPFSPMIVAMFFTCFGLSGVVLTKPIPIGVFSLLPSVVLGVGGAWSSMSLFNKLFAATEASSEAEVWRLVGHEAQVITPIPAGGVGEIQYVARGSTFSAPARTADGEPAGRGTTVTIVDASKAIFTVRKSVEERFRDLERGA
jgi:membrane protein implicated in regulation of membrane protease activity